MHVTNARARQLMMHKRQLQRSRGPECDLKNFTSTGRVNPRKCCRRKLTKPAEVVITRPFQRKLPKELGDTLEAHNMYIIYTTLNPGVRLLHIYACGREGPNNN